MNSKILQLNFSNKDLITVRISLLINQQNAFISKPSPNDIGTYLLKNKWHNIGIINNYVQAFYLNCYFIWNMLTILYLNMFDKN